MAKMNDDGRVSESLSRLMKSAAHLTIIQAEAARCMACDLYKSRTRSSFSHGSLHSNVVIVRGAPSSDEDKYGNAFCDIPGAFLSRMIASMGLSQNSVYICNVVKCRPPEDRDPTRQEASACARFLDEQLDNVRPEVIVALGRAAAERLGCAEPLKEWRGQWGSYRGFLVMPTFEPKHIIRSTASTAARTHMWEDIRRVAALLDR